MSDDRTRDAFDNLRNQATGADPEPSLGRLTRPAAKPARTGPPRWIPAIVAAALVVVVIGVVAVLGGGGNGDGDVVAPPATTDQTVATSIATDNTVPPAETQPTEPPETTDGTIPPGLEPDDTTATTVDPLEGRDPAFVGEGWRVVDVAADDVLNVRQGPGTQYDIVGTLAPDATDVRLGGFSTTIADGATWWNVFLADDTEGWVNARFLNAPVSWVEDVPAELCGVEETPDFGQNGPAPDPADQPDALVGFARVEAGDCDRYIFVLGDYGDAGTYSPVASFNAFGVEIIEGDDEVGVTLPDSLVEAIQVATENTADGKLVLATNPLIDAGLDGRMAMRVFGSYESASLTFRVNPARVILDVIDPIGTPSDLTGGSATQVQPPIVGGPNAQVEVRGFARPFEAQGNLDVIPVAGSTAGLEWSGPSLTFADSEGAAFGASWWPAYGEFIVYMDGLTSGTYDLWVYQSECMEDDSLESLAMCGLSVRFDVP